MTTRSVLDVYSLSGLPFELGRYDVQRVGREEEWKRLLQMTSSARESRSPIMGVLLGTYGSGKSFMFWQLAKHLRETSSSKVLASGPIRLIDPEQKKDFIKGLVLRFFTRGIDVDTQLVPLLKVSKRAVTDMPSNVRPFASVLLALTKATTAPIARRVLGGGRAVRRDAEQAGFPEVSQIKTNEDAVLLLEALQLLVKPAGIDAVAILVDEVEYIDGLSKGARSAVLDSLKNIWDQEVDFFSRGNDAAQLVMVFGATPAFWQKMRHQILTEGKRGDSVVGIVPFVDRIKPSEIVEMPAELAADEARKLIVSRMKEVREGQRKDDIIPFTDDYVDYVYELSQGLPRKIIEICGVVLGEAAQRKLKSIDLVSAKKILHDLLISYEPPVAKK